MLLLVCGKILVIGFDICKINCHRAFMQFSVLMEMHEKFMISIFP